MCLPEQSPRDAALAQLASLDPGLLDATELMGQIAGLAAFISQAQAHLARLAGTLDTTGGAAEGGYSSASAFLRTKCGLSPGHAAAVTSTARGLAARPATREAAEAGVISFDQAQIITRTTTWLEDPATAARIEQALLAHAPGLDTARFRRFAEEAAHSADPDAADEREQRRWERRHLSFGLTLDNTGMLSGSCGDAVSYEIVRTAAEAFGVPGGQADNRCAAQRRMDGLVAACKAALDSATAPGRHGMVPHLSILVCDQTLAQAAAAEAARAAGAAPGAPGACGAPGGPAGQAAGTTPGRPAGGAPGQAASGFPGHAEGGLTSQPSAGGTGQTGAGAGQTADAGMARLAGAPPGQTGHGTTLTARQVLALCCGAQITAIRWRDGLPLGVGRTMRTEPPGLRRALEARDQGCRWPGCGALATWATAHHLTPWAQGGATSLDGLALFCHLHHHHFIHHLGWTITGTPNATLHLTCPGGWLTLDSPLPGAGLLAA